MKRAMQGQARKEGRELERLGHEGKGGRENTGRVGGRIRGVIRHRMRPQTRKLLIENVATRLSAQYIVPETIPHLLVYLFPLISLHRLHQ